MGLTRVNEGIAEFRYIRDLTCDGLRQAITSGKYAPGERLKENELANAFGVSTTPIKQALQRLEIEGLVRTIPMRGSFVSEEADSILAEAGLIRAALEGVAAYLAAQKANDQGIERLQQQASLMKEAAKSGSSETIAAANTGFHQLIHELSQNYSLRQMVTIVGTFDAAMRSRVLAQEEEVERGLQDHIAIAEAIAAHDPERSEELMRRHVLRATRVLERIHENNRDRK